jgi:hypothetical protein
MTSPPIRRIALFAAALLTAAAVEIAAAGPAAADTVGPITGSTTDTPRAFFNGSWGRLRTVVKTPDGGLWLTSTNNDMNGGTPTVLTNSIVRLRFAS